MNLSWYEDRPLFGQTIVVTRSTHQASELTARLENLGALVVEVPVIGLAPPSDGGAALMASAARLSAGEVFVGHLHLRQRSAPVLRARARHPLARRRCRWRRSGRPLPRPLRAYRVVADLVPHDYRSEGLLDVFPPPPPPFPVRAAARAVGQAAAQEVDRALDQAVARSVLLPQAAGARPDLRLGLEERGWEVDAVEAYRTAPQPVSRDLLELAARAGAICFASSSAVDSYIDQARVAGVGPPPIVVCIGPVTAATAQARGLTVSVEASEHTLDGLVSALVEAVAETWPAHAEADPRRP